MGDAEQFVSEALQEGHSMPDIIEAMSQHSNPSLQGFAKSWNQVASQPTYQPGMGPSSGPETQAAPSSLTPGLDMLTSNPYKTAGVAALGYGALQAGRSIPGIIDAARSRYFPNQSEMNATTNAQSDALKAQAYAQQTQAQAAAEAGNQAPEIDAHEEYLKEHERRRAEIKTQMEEAKLEQLRNKGVKPEGKPRPVSPQDQAILDAIARGNVKPVGGPTPAPPPPNIGAPAPTAAPAPSSATQQTAPISNAGQAPAPSAPVDQAPLQGTTEPQSVTSATESGGQTASVDQNAPKSKTEAPKTGIAPKYDLTTGSGMPAVQGTGPAGIRKKEMSGVHELGSDLVFVPHGQNMDIVRNAVGQENYTKLLKENGGYPASLGEAYKQSREMNASLGRDARSVAKEAGKDLGDTTPSITKMVGKNKIVKMGGVTGALISLADLANASPSERANVAGENAVGMLPPALQALLYSKGATSPQELEFERKNKEASAEALRKRQEAAPRLYTPIAPSGSMPPYWK
jgi:hypothetical protein